jgi:hypothetical protein
MRNVDYPTHGEEQALLDCGCWIKIDRSAEDAEFYQRMRERRFTADESNPRQV